ncbi:MAG: DPP IV N-terminal domain-containing protein [Saprospiraceae bacterium]|nr:DPP IV N-terminal domain-containing protein [Saprospiraceae bacterium]MDW8484285.1 DPP IV N-terminal domain-containing protein [Saprospiraceae bacterium]
MKKQFLTIAVLCALLSDGLWAQLKTLSMAEAVLRGRTTLAPASLRQLQWIPGTEQFAYADNDRLVRVNAIDLTADTFDILPALNAELVRQGERQLSTLPNCTWLDQHRLWFRESGNVFIFNIAEGKLSLKTWFSKEAENVDVHPKTLWVAYTYRDGLWISIGGKELGVAQSEADGIVYGKSVHREEFGIRKGTFWSPSGRYLAFYRMDERMVTRYPIYVLDSMPAQVRYIRYPYAGATSHQVNVGIYDTQSGRKWYLNTAGPSDQYLTNVAWTPDERYVIIAIVNRAQNHLWLNLYEVATGKFVRTIFEETHDKWVEPENPPQFVPGSNTDFIWQSERDGFNHLYLYDLSGKLLRQVSIGPTPVTQFLGFSADGTRCFYQTADESGLNRYNWASDLYTDNEKEAIGPNEAGIHQVLVNSSGEWALDVFTSAQTPRLIRLVSLKRERPTVRLLFEAPNPLADYLIGQTRLVTLKSTDGFTLNGRLILPPTFDSLKRYPSVVYVYNGPHVQLVTNSWLYGAELWMHRLAQEGFLVFTLDGRGSANRGYSFESAIFRRLGDVEIEDQLAGVRYLKSLPFVDTTRMGVYGWSYGGFMATSLMTRPEAAEAFRCGIAGGPVLDWRMYEVMYTERYMDTPQENPEGYERSSLFNYIENLKGRLLIIHGSSDDVVLLQHALRYVRECVRKNKPIDFFIYPEHGHNILGRDRVHLFEKIERFFVENLR